jgi:hypothetical protein
MDQSINYSPPKMSFDFGFDAQPAGLDDLADDFPTDDDIVAAANAEALASDDEGFYGQEFGFYAKARPNSGDMEAVNGGYFGADGDDGLARNKSLQEPNLTPITERSEFSTRNSFIGHGGAFGVGSHPPSAGGPLGPASPALARMPVTPLVENEVASFEQLRKLRANAFGGSNGSLRSDYGPAKGPGSMGWTGGAVPIGHHPHGQSPTLSTRSPVTPATQLQGGYFNSMGGTPMVWGYSNESSGSSNRSSAHPGAEMRQPLESTGTGSPLRQYVYESPRSAVSSNHHHPFSSPSASDLNPTTPKKPSSSSSSQQQQQEPPTTARKIPTALPNSPPPVHPGQANGRMTHSHSRKGSDSVTYVREQDPAGSGQPRWVLERRRTSEQGQLELIGREVVQGGWI